MSLKKLQQCPEKWEKNIKKQAVKNRRQGNPFQYVRRCCKKKCYELLNAEIQSDLYLKYQSCSTKESEDLFLSTMMKWSFVEHQKVNSIRPRNLTWKYTMMNNDIDIITCKSMYRSLFQVTDKRMRGIQKKIFEQSGFKERRGTHNVRRIIATDEMKALMYAHLLTIPHRKSHYTKSKMLYFEHTDLTIKQLYNLFKKFYRKKKDEPCELKLKHYYKLFQKLKFSVSNPKTDSCDICEKYKIERRRNPTNMRMKVGQKFHNRIVRLHKKLKDHFLSNPAADTLLIEFDYGQNLSLPKLAINKQFYKRLLWLYNLNIHCHNDKDSSFYTFLESDGKKNANSVISYLHHFLISKGLGSNDVIRRVVLFSDNAGGQNKNITMVRFCSWLSKRYDVEIKHIFPVRGHSFCVCDRNFGVYGRRLKKTSPITSVQQYLKVMRECRSKLGPFNVLYNHPILDYEKMFSESKAFFPKHANFKIRSYRRLMYKHGILSASQKYYGDSKPYQIVQRNVPRYDFPPIAATRPGISAMKRADLLSLVPYINNREDSDFFRGLCK